MVAAALSKLSAWTRDRRFKKYAYDPARAPHRPLVSALVRAHLPSLAVRLRHDHVDDLVTRILNIETTAIPLVEEPEPKQLVLLMARAQQVITQIETDQTVLERRFARFSEMFTRVDDDEQKRYLVAQYLVNTSQDPKALKGDLKAIERHLGYDVLRERNATELAHLSITIETGLQFLGLAGKACLGHEDHDHRPSLTELLDQTHTARFLSDRMERADRWQARLAAGEALLQLCKASTQENPFARSVHDSDFDTISTDPHGDKQMATDRRLAVLATIKRCAGNIEEHAWVQAKALELLLVLDINQARDVLNARLFGEKPEVRTDFLFRRLAVSLAGRYLRVLGATSLLVRMLERPDPSEHVRMGVCETMIQLPPAAAISALTRVVGANATVAETSARVRATAVIALSRVVREGELDASDRDTVVETLATVIESETDALVLEVACEELRLVADELGRGEHTAFAERWVPRWQAALARAICAPGTPPRMCDLAAATAEALERRSYSDRTALTAELHTIVYDIRPGHRKRVAWRQLSEAAAAAARDPMVLGRCLAELSHEDWGVSAHIGKRGLILWRGDVFRTRMWRVIHEMRNPAPNKRQGYDHARGRAPQGEVRAPPALLDEVTPTTVPGERTHVDEAGGWGRYLPMVDDILDLPVIGRRPVRLFSGHGVTIITPPASLWRRLKNRIYVTWKYRELAGQRQASLAATEAAERHRYVRALAEKLDIQVAFEGYQRQGRRQDQPVTSERILTLFRGKSAMAAAQETAAAAAPAAIPLIEPVRDWIIENGPYFLSLTENSQRALAIFLTIFLCGILVWSHVRRRRLARARESIPLSIGGWGTRGKSGTERLKGGLFHGLGYHVLAKTTGCEAMFINAQPGQEAIEIFLYRPYDKATIWEQADVLNLAQGVGADVFLWECMALNPRYVGILQHEWMQDDVTTLTNAYPDHEDIQGPAGCDVATVISTFIPHRSIVLTSETNFLPLFAQVSKERRTDFHAVPSREGDLIAGDVLDLFPYNEHPRNISLVARMAERLGIDPELAIVTMAENVVPDLGVLKAYAPACVRGRLLTFVNGMSANERTGFLNNWRRMGLDRLDPDEDAETQVITVVNNRADRISRSKVFADILVGDVAVDRHVLIGTNLKGLRSYLNTALDQYLADKRLVQDSDLDEPEPETLPLKRLAREMKRFRIARPGRDAVLSRLAAYARGADLRVDTSAMDELGKRIDTLLVAKGDEPIRIEEIERNLAANSELKSLIEGLLTKAETEPRGAPWIETLEPPKHDDIIKNLFEALGRMLVRARLEARLRQVVASRTGIDKFHADFGIAYRALFERSLVVVHDPGTPGDRIIEMCAAAVPPGTQVTVLGTQNIKGTGLDFVYRWIAIDKVSSLLDQLGSNRSEQRIAALSSLEAYEDYGLFGAGLARRVLSDSRFSALSAQEESLRERAHHKADAVFKSRRSQLGSAGGSGGGGSSGSSLLINWMEGWIDYLDSIRRRRQSKQLMADLTSQRISLARAAIEMRAVVGRQKGGWLAKSLKRRKASSAAKK